MKSAIAKEQAAKAVLYLLLWGVPPSPNEQLVPVLDKLLEIKAIEFRAGRFHITADGRELAKSELEILPPTSQRKIWNVLLFSVGVIAGAALAVTYFQTFK